MQAVRCFHASRDGQKSVRAGGSCERPGFIWPARVEATTWFIPTKYAGQTQHRRRNRGLPVRENGPERRQGAESLMSFRCSTTSLTPGIRLAIDTISSRSRSLRTLPWSVTTLFWT